MVVQLLAAVHLAAAEERWLWSQAVIACDSTGRLATQ